MAEYTLYSISPCPPWLAYRIGVVEQCCQMLKKKTIFYKNGVNLHACVYWRQKDCFRGATSGIFKSFSWRAKTGEIYFLTPETKKRAFFAEICIFLLPSDQARNQLGTPGEAKSFMKGAQIF